MKRTAQMIAQGEEIDDSGDSEGAEDQTEKFPRGKHPKSLANLKPYKAGDEWEGNRSGRSKYDVASRICRQLFEGNEEEIYKALAKEIIAKGSAYAFQVASERAYGKLKQGVEHSGEMTVNENRKLENLTTEELDALRELTRKLTDDGGDRGGDSAPETPQD